MDFKESTEFEWDIFLGFTTLQLCDKINDLLSKWGTPETFTGRILFVSMFTDISCDKKDNEMKKKVWQILRSSLSMRRSLVWDNVIGPGSEKKWSSMEENSPQWIWDHIAEKCWWNSLRVDVQFSVQRLHCPDVNSEAKKHGKLSIHFAADQETIETIFRIIVFSNQLNLHGAVANMCAECESVNDRSGQPYIVMRHSIVSVKSRQRFLWRITSRHTRIFHCNNMKNESNYFHQKTEWVNSVRKQDLCVLLKLDNISWPRTLVILDNFAQWLVANTLCLEMIQLHNQKDGSREIQELDPYWKLEWRQDSLLG